MIYMKKGVTIRLALPFFLSMTYSADHIKLVGIFHDIDMEIRLHQGGNLPGRGGRPNDILLACLL